MSNIKEFVKKQYSKWVTESNSCCSSECCQEGFSESYSSISGYNKDADYGLGCGLPLEFAKIEKGNTILDLGCGAGNDCFIARSVIEEDGKVIGLDFSEVMIDKARKNAKKLNYKNLEFIHGDIESIPLKRDLIDVVISNCVLNLVPDKRKVFSEIKRVLKSSGHFSISDVVVSHEMPEEMRMDSDLYASCISSAISKSNYLAYITEAGFENVEIQKERELKLSDAVYEKYPLPKGFKILSITIYGEA